MTDKLPLEIEVKKWIELEVRGNYKCPTCSDVLIVLAYSGKIVIWVAFCPSCKKYFADEGSLRMIVGIVRTNRQTRDIRRN